MGSPPHPPVTKVDSPDTAVIRASILSANLAAATRVNRAAVATSRVAAGPGPYYEARSGLPVSSGELDKLFGDDREELGKSPSWADSDQMTLFSDFLLGLCLMIC